MKTKIIIVIDHLGLGGAQQQVLEYLKYADRNQYDIRIVNLDASYNFLGDKMSELGFGVISISHRGFFNFGTIIKLTRLFKKEKPDIVHTYLLTADCYGRLAAWLAGIKCIISSVRNIDCWKKWHHMYVDRLLARVTREVVINADIIRSFLMEKEGIPDKKITRIYNGIDLRRFEGLRGRRELRTEFNIPNDALIVGMVSRFSAQKDYKTFLKAAENILNKRDDVYFLAVGEGALREELEREVKSRKCGEKIIFTGLRRDVPHVMGMMDVGVLSTNYEGCPNVVLEYMACSKPVVATNVDGCPELIVEGKTGFLVPSADPAALAESLLKLLEDKFLREKMGAAGRARIENEFTSERLAGNIEALYASLIKPKIAFLLSQFPEMHETFILREFLGLENKGINFDIYSLKKCKDKIIHPEVEGFMSKTFYTPVFCIVSFFYWLIVHPRKFFKADRCVYRYSHSLLDFIKAKAVFFRSLYFARLMRRNNIGHIHAHWATMPTTGAEIISILLDIPFSFTAHAWDIYLNNRESLRQKIRNARFVLTCTKANKEYLDQLDQKEGLGKVVVNYHGMDLQSFTLRDDQKCQSPIILAIGRLVEQKGFEYLIKACGILKQKLVNFECIIVGEGPLRKDLEGIRDNLGLGGAVKMLGSTTQDQIKKFFQKAGVFTAPSVIAQNGDRDGIPNVLIEALAIGVPVIATKVSGIPEIIVDQNTGILIPERNEEALADAMMDVLQGKAPLHAFKANGRTKIEREFDIKKNIDEFVEVFDNAK